MIENNPANHLLFIFALILPGGLIRLMHVALKKYLDRKISLSPEHEQLVSDFFVPVSTSRNQVLVSKGSVASYMYFIIRGCFRIFLTDENDNESTRFFAFEGEFATAFPSFILREPSSASVQCTEPCELLRITFEDRQILLRDVPGWEKMTRHALEIDYIAAIQRVETFITMNSSERYHALLRSNPEIVKRLPSKIVADYLGISQETLSRLKGKP
jgi:CRP/FNR family transcriptional regulator, cyclic AMP receptor protein